MRLNLNPMVRFTESLMNDTCVITRDPEGPTDNDWDGDIGMYIEYIGDRNVIYQGKTSMYWLGSEYKEIQGMRQTRVSRYMGSIPKDAPEVRVKDRYVLLAVDSVNGDPHVVGKNLVVGEVYHGSYTVSQRFSLELRSQVPINA